MAGTPSNPQDATPPNAPEATGSPPTPPPKIVRRGGSRTVVFAVVAVVILVALVAAAGVPLGWYKGKASSPPGTCPTGQTLSGAGASLVTPIITSWGYAYGKSSGNSVNYAGTGAGAGASSFIGRSIDFAATDGPLNASQTASLPAPALSLPLVGGAVAIIYNLPGFSGTLNFSGPVLSGIYNGSIADWNASAIQAINPGAKLPGNPIQTVHRLDIAGTTQVLTDYIARTSAGWKDGPGVGLQISWPTTPTPAKAVSGNSNLAKYVNTTSYTIGYVDLADAHAVKNVGIGAVLNPSANYVVPTAADTQSAIDDAAGAVSLPSSGGDWSGVDMVDASGASDYPLAALAYGFLYQALDKGYQPSLQKAQALYQWFEYAITTGQSSASALYYAPLPTSIVSIDQTGLGSLTYGGNALPSCG